jgi:hypothetical protein
MKLALVLKDIIFVFFGRSVESNWKPGSEWILRMPGRRADVNGRACARLLD